MSWTFQRVALLCAGIAAVGTIPVAVLIGSVFGWQAGGLSVLLGWFFCTPLFGLLANNVFVSESAQPGTDDRTPNHTQSPTSLTPDDQSHETDSPRESDTASDEQSQDEFDRTLERFLEADDHDPDGLLDR